MNQHLNTIATRSAERGNTWCFADTRVRQTEVALGEAGARHADAVMRHQTLIASIAVTTMTGHAPESDWDELRKAWQERSYAERGLDVALHSARHARHDYHPAKSTVWAGVPTTEVGGLQRQRAESSARVEAARQAELARLLARARSLPVDSAEADEAWREFGMAKRAADARSR